MPWGNINPDLVFRDSSKLDLVACLHSTLHVVLERAVMNGKHINCLPD